MGINSNFAEFLQDLHQYKNKVHELDRIQFSEGANLQTIFPVLWEEVLQHHPSIHLRFYAYSNFDVDWIASFTDLENLSIEVGGNNSIIRNLEKTGRISKPEKFGTKFRQRLRQPEFPKRRESKTARTVFVFQNKIR